MRPSLALSVLSSLLAGALLAPDTQAATASLAARLEAKGIKYEIDPDGDYKLTYSYEKEKRTQLVFVSGSVEEVEGFRILEIYSPAARLEKDGVNGAKAIELMADSRKSKIGSWEIGGDVLYFVIKLPEDIDADRLATAIDIAAEKADNLELTLSGDRDEL